MPEAQSDSQNSAFEASDVRLDNQVNQLLRRAHQRASARLSSLLDAHKLTPSQYAAMQRLAELNQVSQNRLGRLTAMDPATIQGVVQRLVTRGHIERRPDPKDRRRMLLRLTGDGRALVSALHAKVRKADESLLEPLDPKERIAFINLLCKLL